MYAQPTTLHTATGVWSKAESTTDLSPAVKVMVGVHGGKEGEGKEGAAAEAARCVREALEWCVHHGFELVEWKSEEGKRSEGVCVCVCVCVCGCT